MTGTRRLDETDFRVSNMNPKSSGRDELHALSSVNGVRCYTIVYVFLGKKGPMDTSVTELSYAANVDESSPCM